MAPKKVTTRASSSLDEDTKVALVDKKGKATLAEETLPATTENKIEAINNKNPRSEYPSTGKAAFIHVALGTSLMMTYQRDLHQ
jgi:hypothetical protein